MEVVRDGPTMANLALFFCHTIISLLHLFSPNCFYNHRTDGKTEPLFDMLESPRQAIVSYVSSK